MELRYGGGARTLLWVVTGLSVLETAGLHLVLRHHLVIAVIADVLGAAVLVFLALKALSVTRYPHVVDDQGVRLRHGRGFDVLLPFASIASTRWDVDGSHSARKPYVREASLVIPVERVTNVVVTLATPVHAMGTDVREVVFAVDSRAEYDALASRLSLAT